MAAPPRTGRRLPPEIVVLGVGTGAAVFIVLLHIAVPRAPWAPQWREPGSAVGTYFDVAREQNLPTWFNVSLLLLAAAMAALAAALARTAGNRAALPWAGLALVCAALSLDDMTSLHERLHPLGVRIGGGSGLTYAAWLVPGLAFAALVVLAIALLVRRVGRRARLLLMVGVGCLLAGAFGVESLGNAVLEAQGYGRAYAYLLVVEEFLEAFGAVCLLAAPFAELRIQHAEGGLQLAYRPSAQTAR
ncbi:MAG: hypothetical protein H0V64_07790 [Geodermatophilaceae bacterium]|nr:hypothetical protein [Geodermatophilaceae bacterium]MDQ3463754.1 hypothetical protein [Actinomycetota bacterium]